MKFPYVGAVALLVVLAGCGGLVGGGGTATPTDAPETPAPEPTPSATAEPTQTATATSPTISLPDSYTTRTVRNESLRVTFELVGNRGALRSFLLADIAGNPVTQGAVLSCARTTPFVAASTNRSVDEVTVTMGYNPDLLSPNATESELSVFVYNRTVDFYLEMETTVDAANDTATAGEVTPGQTFTRETENGTERVSPKLDGTRLDNAFVVMHAPTWWEAVETREVPSRCASTTPTPTDGTATGTPN